MKNLVFDHFENTKNYRVTVKYNYIESAKINGSPRFARIAHKLVRSINICIHFQRFYFKLGTHFFNALIILLL